MVEAEQARASRSRWRRAASLLPDLLVVLLVGFAFLAWHFDLGDRWGLAAPDPATEPALVLPPEGLTLPAQAPAPVVAQPLDSAQPSAAAVARAVSGLLRDPDLGRHVDLLVTDLTTGRTVYRHGSGTVTPASTMKLLTSVSALQSIGPETRFATSVRRVPGTNRLVLVGGGDPYLAAAPTGPDAYPARADLATLARRTARAMRADGVRTVRLGYDDSLFSGPTAPSSWPPSYLSTGVVPPITALWVDEGHRTDGAGFVDDPSLQAAQVFGAALERQGLTVAGDPQHRRASKGAQRVAGVASPPLGQIVSHLLLVSDNAAAEVVAHHVGLQVAGVGSFAGGASAVRTVLGRLGIPLDRAVITDGSGLSRNDRLEPRTLAGVLRVASGTEHPTLRQVVTGMPVAGFSGSLQFRFDTGAPAGRGRVQAKTGTLTGVHGLAGVATDLDDDVLGFVAIADHVRLPDQLAARQTIDQVAAALGACHCGSGT